MTEETQPQLQLFVDQLIKEKRFDSLDPAVVEEMRRDLITRVTDHINAAIVRSMPQDKLPEFNKLMDSTSDQQKVEQFINDNVADLEGTIALELIKFRETYLS